VKIRPTRKQTIAVSCSFHHAWPPGKRGNPLCRPRATWVGTRRVPLWEIFDCGPAQFRLCFFFFPSLFFFFFIFVSSLFYFSFLFFCSNLKIVQISNFIQILKLFRFRILFKFDNCSDFNFCSHLKIVQISNLFIFKNCLDFDFCSNLKIVQISFLFKFEICSDFQI
jgi:hypothetical protein